VRLDKETNADFYFDTNALAMCEASNAALRERIGSLEAQLSAIQPQAADSNSSLVVPTGTWTCTNTDSCGAIIRQVSISTSGSGAMISVTEIDSCFTGNWGTVPLLALGTNYQNQGSLYALGIFSGGAGEGGFQDRHKLYLIVRFDTGTLWTVWSDVIHCANCVPGVFEHRMFPLN
jgi:hypothetical protein